MKVVARMSAPSLNFDARKRRNAVLYRVALAIEKLGEENLGGFDRIETKEARIVSELPVVGTVFEYLARVLSKEGFPSDGTVGGVMEILAYPRNSEESAEKAHELGCYCNGELICSMTASKRVRNLMTY